MASVLIQGFTNFVKKIFKTQHEQFNRVIYNYLGDTMIWNPENDRTYIDKGYRFNSTVYSIINLINKTACMIPFQVFEIKSENELKRYKSIMSGYQTGASLQKAQMIKKHALEELEHTDIHEVIDQDLIQVNHILHLFKK